MPINMQKFVLMFLIMLVRNDIYFFNNICSRHFSTADILTSHNTECTGETNNVNDGSVFMYAYQ